MKKKPIKKKKLKISDSSINKINLVDQIDSFILNKNKN